MSQFHPTQHVGDNDFQIWQQQMMYKQLQEFQRQQLQQPDHGARMQPFFGQLHAPAKPLPDDQFSTMSNEMVNNEAASSAWPQNFFSRDPSLMSNSPMLNNGSTNWDQLVGAPGMGNFINGSMFTNAQSQSVRPMGLATHQVDQSFYPIHAASNRGSENQYSQFLGIHANSQSAMARIGPDQFEKTSRPFNSSMNEHSLHVQGTSSLMQNFGNGGFLNNSPMQNQGDHINAGSPVTTNHLQLGFQAQVFHGKPNQVDFQVGVQEKATVPAGSTSGRASLDPTEEKILFGSDEDSNWGALLRGDDDHGSSLDNDNLGGAGAYSSLNSGSWSALMQEALQSTTSEKNSPKEQWSGLSFQKNEQVIANTSTLSGRDENKLAELSGTNLENARPSPASGYGDGTMDNSNLANFQHAVRTPYERREPMPHESPSATVNNHPSTSEVNDGYFQQSLKQNQSDRRQEQQHLANGMWAHQKSELLRNNSHSTGTRASPPSVHGFWMSQQNPANHTINRETSNNQNDWKPNNAPGQDVNNTPNVFNSGENTWKPSGGNTNSVYRLQQMKSDISTAQRPTESSDGKNMNMVGSSMPMVTQDHYQVMTGQTGEQVGMNHNMGHRVPETSESPGNSTDQRSSDCNQEYLNANSNESNAHFINHGQPATSDSAARRHPTLAGKESQNFSQSGEQVMGSYKLQNRAMGNSGMNFGHSPSNPVSNSLFALQSHQMRNNLQHHFGTNSHVSSNTPSVNEKMLMAQEQLQSRHGLPNNPSAFGGSDAGLSQNRAVQNSQHMLQLLHKVDNSRNNSAAADMSNNSFGIVSAQQQPNQPTMQGFGLRLAPPSQRQSSSGHLWSSQTNSDGKQSDHSAQEDDLTQLPSTTSQSMTSSHPNPQSSAFHSSKTNNSGQLIGHFPRLSSGQQYPAEARSGSSTMPLQPQQGSSATVFKNVWTNISAQRLAGMQANKITPNILQSMMFPNNTGASNLWNSQKTDDQGQRAATPPDVATSSANSQSQDTKQALDGDSGLASSQKAIFESTGAIVPGGNGSLQKPSSDGNYTNPVTSFAQMRQQGIMNAKQGDNPGANFQAMNASHNPTHNSGGIVLHGSPAPSNVQQQNYSLLHQMQAMRRTNIDPGNAVGKTINSEIGSDASPGDWKSGQRFAHVPSNSTKLSTDNNGSPGIPGSFPSDMKMLSFASRSEERDASIPSQLPSGEGQSHVMVTAQNDHQNKVQPIGMTATPNSVESERPRINPQMAPSWFGHYGSYRNGQNLAMLNAQKTSPLPYNFPKPSWNIDNNSAEHRVESGQPVRPGHLPPSTKVDALVSPNVKATSMMRRPKKRKSMESVLVSWHKIIEGPQKVRNIISTCEMDWAWAANRLTEKDETEALDDGPLNYLPRKRLILTTRLIQQLLPAIPATILRAQAVSAYESATYTLSMLTLRDACSMAASSLYNSCTPADDENNPSEQMVSAKKMEENLSKAAEVFIGRIRKMENGFISLNKRASMLDVQLECQDLERISLVNRLGRFHGRNHAAAIEGSSGSELIHRRIFPERHVMSFAVPGNLPEGAYCLSL